MQSQRGKWVRVRRPLEGRKFHRWTVISFQGVVQENSTWLCVCECGTERVVSQPRLVNGKSKSCGCWRVERTRRDATKHGKYKAPEYTVWEGIVQRCTNPNSSVYADYGGRGITICNRWRNDFGAFYEDMCPRPAGYTIERIENNKGYEPGNCRWATQAEQLLNTRRSRIITADGISMPAIQWARRSGIKRETIVGRLRAGWSPEDAVSRPTQKTRKHS